MGRVLFIILAIFLLLGAFASPILDGIHGWRTEEITNESHPVITGAGVTTANLTLAEALFQDKISEVNSVTSNVTAENPVLWSSYDSATGLLVYGLIPGITRSLIVNYYAETDSTVLQAVGPFLGVLIIGACVVIVFMGSKKGR